MTQITIFKDKKKKLNLPTFIDSRGLICANSGGGKSYCVRKILEETHGKVMAIILDVEGEFKTLREKFDFLLIGQDADVQLNLRSAHLLPKKLLELNVSTIIDISDLKMHERIQYAKKFLEALMEVSRDLWKPCIVVLDESHLLAGQQEKQESTHAVIDLMTRGRKRGYCGILCTQRISKLHKDAVAETNNYFVGRTGLDIDMKRAAEILGFTEKKDMLSLRDLEPGEFYVFGPAISKYVEKAMIDEVQTTHPKVGMDIKSRIVAPTDKIKALLTKISDLPKEAEEELRNLNDYRKKVSELQHKIRTLELGGPRKLDEKATQKIREQAWKESSNVPEILVKIERAKKHAYKEAEDHYNKQMNSLKANYNQIERKLIDIGKILGKELPKFTFEPVQFRPHIQPKAEIQRIPVSVRKVSEKSPAGYDSEGNEFSLNLCERKIYSLLYQYQDRDFTKPQMGIFTGYSHTSGGFSNALSHLRQLNLIEGQERVRIKEIRDDLAQEFDFSMRAIISKLNKCEKEIYEALLDNPHYEFSKEEVSDITPSHYSPTSGGFNNAISRLNTLGVIQRNSGNIKINPEILEL